MTPWKEVMMYIDSVIIFSLIVLALIVYMMIYIGLYIRKHMKMDSDNSEEGNGRSPMQQKPETL